MGQPLRTPGLFSREAWRAPLAEFIGTMLFVFVGAGSVVANRTLTPADFNPTVAIALGHGLAIAVLVYATAHISGGHINPAVTFAMVLTRRMTVARGLRYVAAQLAGGVVGAVLLKLAVPGAAEGNLGAHALGSGMNAGMGTLTEVVLTFILVFVVFAMAVDSRGQASLAPLAIGLAVLADHLVGVPLTGASMNPARSLGPALVAGAWADHWVYWVGPLIGAAAAGLTYRAVFLERSEPGPS